MDEKLYKNHILPTAKLIEEYDNGPNKEVETWEEIESQYSSDEYPAFGGPFTDALSVWEWLKLNYNPPVRKS